MTQLEQSETVTVAPRMPDYSLKKQISDVRKANQDVSEIQSEEIETEGKNTARETQRQLITER